MTPMTPMDYDPDCLFCKIAGGAIASRKVYEDEELFVFHDIAPWAPAHLLLIPKRHIATLYDATDADTALLGRMLAMAPRLMESLGVTNGFRVQINTGSDGGQEVQHLHMHVMGGPRPWARG